MQNNFTEAEIKMYSENTYFSNSITYKKNYALGLVPTIEIFMHCVYLQCVLKLQHIFVIVLDNSSKFL